MKEQGIQLAGRTADLMTVGLPRPRRWFRGTTYAAGTIATIQPASCVR